MSDKSEISDSELMHELHRAEALIKELRKRGFSGKLEIEVSHIEKTMITLEEVQECFDILAENTDLYGSMLMFTEKKIALRCSECGTTHNIEETIPMKCRNCNSTSLQIDEEDDLTISRIKSLKKNNS